jgi:hypothetical protein
MGAHYATLDRQHLPEIHRQRRLSALDRKHREIAFTSAVARTIQKFGAPIASGALTNLAIAFRDQKLTHGGALFGALVRIMSRPCADFDPDRLLIALSTRTADEWGKCVTGISSGNEREAALRAAIMATYEKTSMEAQTT